mgnify:CR=1 FL=1
MHFDLDCIGNFVILNKLGKNIKPGMVSVTFFNDDGTAIVTSYQHTQLSFPSLSKKLMLHYSFLRYCRTLRCVFDVLFFQKTKLCPNHKISESFILFLQCSSLELDIPISLRKKDSMQFPL